MKSLLFPLFLYLGILSANAQTATVALVTAPCHNDGVVAISTTGLTPPLTFSYYFGTGAAPTISHSGITTTTDTLSFWPGGDMIVFVTDGAGYASGGLLNRATILFFYQYFCSLPYAKHINCNHNRRCKPIQLCLVQRCWHTGRHRQPTQHHPFRYLLPCRYRQCRLLSRWPLCTR